MEAFGSATRADFRPDSDVDLIVEPRPGGRPRVGEIVRQSEMATSASLSAGVKEDDRVTAQAVANLRRERSGQQVDVPAEQVLHLAGQSGTSR